MTLITPGQRALYHTEGYMILPGIIPPDMLTMLREECSYFLGYKDSQMDSKGITVDGINHRGRRYFIGNLYRLSQRMREFIFSPMMAEIAQAALGPDVFLFNEQWVVKNAEQGMKFSWHQDSGYVKRSHPDVAHEYAALKRDLAAHSSARRHETRQAYAETKRGFIERITRRALTEESL